MAVLNDYPRHIAIIMDGSGRWAKKRGLMRIAGHRAGMEAIHKIIPVCDELGIEILTLYVFSKENWTRPKMEIKGLMSLLIEFLDRELQAMMKKGVCLSAIGNLEELPQEVYQKLIDAIEQTKTNTGVKINLAVNYGGRQEILQAVNQIIRNVHKGQVKAEDIDATLISQHLYTADLPDPDLLIRTSGEERISNFLLWQLSYSEIYGITTLWPDFGEEDFRQAVNDYLHRERRYGDVRCRR